MQTGCDSPPPPLFHVLIGCVGSGASLVRGVPQLRDRLLVPALDLLQRLICIRFCLNQLLPQLSCAKRSAQVAAGPEITLPTKGCLISTLQALHQCESSR